MSVAPGARDAGGRRWMIALGLVTLLAAALRLYSLSRVPVDPFYDAAVRSMTHSLHNFLFGAFEPGGSASIDKPPVDLWLQVVAVKILGFNSSVLKLPGALAGAVAVPLTYALVRRLGSRTAALTSATVLAVLPASVITSRSDTMDSVMMALLVAAAYLLLLGVQQRRLRWVLLGAAVLGVAFNVKLFEALVPAPAFALFVLMGLAGESRSRRAGWAAAATGVFVLVALSWLVAISLAPRHERPFALGSTHGSAWDATFVYNGLDRITKPAQPSSFDADPLQGTLLASLHPVALPPPPLAARAPSAPAGPVRLFERSRVDFGGLLGTVLFAALLFGAIAAWHARALLIRPPPQARVARAALWGLALWLATGLLLFSFAARVHPRYLEAFTPAVSITLGVSLTAVVARARDARGVAVLLAALAAAVAECAVAAGPSTLARAGLALGVLLAAMLAAVLLLALHDSRRLGRWPQWCGAGLVCAGALAALLAFPLARDLRVIHEHSGVQAAAPLLAPREVAALSSYLRAHQSGAHYEVAAAAPSVVDQLIVRDGRPVLLLTAFDARPLVTLAQLQRDAASGRVRYLLVHGRCPAPPYHVLPACSATVRWAATHGHDVTGQLNLPGVSSGLLYAL